MTNKQVEIKIETNNKHTDQYKYSSISNEHQQDDEGSHSNSDVNIINSRKAYNENELPQIYLQQLKRTSNDNTTIPTNIIQFCVEYIGHSEHIELEKELNGNSNYKLFDYDNESHLDDTIGYIHGCKHSQHIKSFILSLLLLFILFWALICEMSSYSVATCNASFWYDYWWLVIFCLLYIAYFIEFILSSTNCYLYNLYNIKTFKQYIAKIRLLSPRMWLEFQCIEDAKKMLTSRHFVYSTWTDTSDNISDLYLNNNDEISVIKLKMDRFLLFENINTAKVINNEMNEYVSKEIDENGKYFDVNDGICKRWAINDDDNKRNVLLYIGIPSFKFSYWFYCFVSCLLCSTCYRIWFSSKTTKRRYKIIKTISL
eukprot:469715_1